jgi:hypothetical protein
MDTAMMCKDDLRKLFLLRGDVSSDTHDFLKCKRCPRKATPPNEEGAAACAPPPLAAGAPLLPLPRTMQQPRRSAAAAIAASARFSAPPV